MKKSNFKKTVIIVLAAASAIMSLSIGCGKVKGPCEACGETKPLYKLTMTANFLGVSNTESSKLCKTCADLAIEALEEEGDSLGVITSYTCEEMTK